GDSFLFPAGTTAQHVSLAGDTSLLTKSTYSVSDCTGYSAPEAIYAVTTRGQGAIRASLRTAYPGATIYVRRECYAGDTQVTCQTQALPNTPAESTFSVDADDTSYIFVDGAALPGGKYTLDLTWMPPTCGDGIVQAPETCDDGNATNG